MGNAPDEDVAGKGSKRMQYISAVIANIPAFCNGVMMGWPSIAIPILQSAHSPIGEVITDEESSLIACLLCLVAFIGTPLINITRARFGNKFNGYLFGVLNIINWLIIIATRNKILIFVARTIAGLSAATLTVFSPLYTNEIAADEIRGTLGVFFILFFNSGYLFVNTIAAFLSYTSIAVVCAIPAAIFILCFIKMPETPIYLMMKGKTLEATKSLQWFRGKNADITSELNKMKGAVEAAGKTEEMTFREALSDRGTRIGLLIVLLIPFNCEFSGISAVLSYLGSIFIDAGIDLSYITASIIVAALQLFGTILSSYLVERMGRRCLLITANITISVCLGSLGTYFYLKNIGNDVSSITWLPVAALSIFLLANAIGLGPLCFVILPEICLPAASKFVSNMGFCTTWMSSLILTSSFNTLSNIVGIHSCFWFFTGICMFGASFAYFVLPETKGRPRQEIHAELSRRKTLLRSGKKDKYVYSSVSDTDATPLNDLKV